jgi:RHS repeat-associated protein
MLSAFVKAIGKLQVTILSFCLILIICSNGLSQSQPAANPKLGVANGATYSVSDIENINLTNGNLILNLPLAGLPRGRGEVAQSLSLRYNSKLYETGLDEMQDISGQISLQRRLMPNNDSGWAFVNSSSYNLNVTTRDAEDRNSCTPQTVAKKAYIWKVEMIMPDGSKTLFRPAGSTDYFSDDYYDKSPNGFKWTSSITQPWLSPTYDCSLTVASVTNDPMTYYSTDGSYLKLVIDNDTNPQNQDGRNNPWTLYFPDGKKITGGQGLPTISYDRNGNNVQGLTDNVGRSVLKLAGLNQNEDIVRVKGVNNEDVDVKVKWKPIYVKRPYQTEQVTSGTRGNPSNQTHRGSFRVIDEITLPVQSGGLKYVFSYYGSDTPIPTGQTSSGWGELASITMPNGAVVNYEYDYRNEEGENQPRLKDILANSVKKKTLTYNLEYDGVTTPTSEVWNYDIENTGSVVTSPDGSTTSQAHGDVSYENQYSGLVTAIASSNGTTVEKSWGFNGTPWGGGSGQINPFVKAEFTSIKDSLGNYAYTTVKEFNYDKNGNVTQVKEYDWMPYFSGTTIPAGVDPIRVTQTAFYNSTNDSSDTSTTTANCYWVRNAPNLLNTVAAVEVRNESGQIVTRSEIFYDNPSTTGNPIQSKSWDSSKGAYSNPLNAGNSVSSTIQYNQYGMPILSTDAKGIQTQITYGTVGSVTDLYPTMVKTAFGLPEQRTSSSTYDFFTGLTKTATDVDNNVTNETVYDSIGRPIISKAAINTPNEIWSQMEYNDQLRRVVSRSDLFVKGDGKKVSIQHYDQLGRVRLSRTLEDVATQNPYNEADGIKVQTRYRYDNPTNPGLSNGSFQMTSNPYRTGNEPEMGWTVSYSDKTGKTSTTKTYAGGAMPAPWGSNASLTGTVLSQTDANTATVTDQAGKQRRSITNGLGQLVRVDEPDDSGNLGTVASPTQPTLYAYDTLNNLVQVNQGVQVRSFGYDSLLRLRTATNPESGLIQYSYDNNGNLTSKTDARNVVTNYVYDNLNRVTTRNYTDGTPAVTYTYDNLPFAKGKLTQVASAISTTKYTNYDNLGRVLNHQQITDGQTYNTAYTYNLSGALVNETYPSGRVVTNQFESDGDLAAVVGSYNGGAVKTYAANIFYTSAGAVNLLQLGNGRWENTTFNSRLQPTQIGLGTTSAAQDLWKVNYDFGSTDNNGNVRSQQITIQGQFQATQNYSYDSLNRLKTAAETVNSAQTWKQTFAFDRYGNRKFDPAQTTTLGGCPVAVCNPDINPANNKVVGHTFDNSGNTTIDAEGKTFFYDAENKQKEVRNAQNQIIGQYLYDGNGSRVKKISAAETTIFVYDASNKLVAEYLVTASTPQAPQTSYLTNDTLGSPRVITNSAGAVTSRRDFMPYGEEINGLGGRSTALGYAVDNTRQKFTGYERDVESGQDFAQARYYNSKLGRFNSVDSLMASAKTANPKTFNRYNYVGNNPINISDPFGLDWYYNNEENRYRWSADGKTFKDGDEVGSGWKSVVGSGGNGGSFVYNSDKGWVSLNPYGNNYTISDTQEAATSTFDGRCANCQELANTIAEQAEIKGKVVGGVMATGVVLGTGAGFAMAATGTVVGGSVTTLGLTEATGAATTVATVAAANPQATQQALNSGVQSVSQLLNSMHNASQLTSKAQGFVQGNAQQIFNNITQGGAKISDTLYKMPDGTFVKLYNSSTNGVASISINQAGKMTSVRITP